MYAPWLERVAVSSEGLPIEDQPDRRRAGRLLHNAVVALCNMPAEAGGASRLTWTASISALINFSITTGYVSGAAVRVGLSFLPASNRIVSDPSRTDVPSASGAGASSRAPANHVPFLLPRCSSNAVCPATTNRACCREIESASSWRAHIGSRPMIDSPFGTMID